MSLRSAIRAVKGTSLAAALLPVCSAAAVAAPPAPAVDGWAGPYIGAYFTVAGGRAHEATDQVQLSTSLTRQAHGEYSGPVTGATVDLFAGRNWQFGNFVVGGQAEATIASDVDLNVTGTVRTTDINTNGPSTNISTQTRANRNQLRFSAGLVGRAGFLARPDLLLYGLAGVEFGHFIFNDGDDQFGSANRSLAAGYTAGAGIEARFSEHWSLRAEYRYTHFGMARSETLPRATFLGTTRQDNVDMQTGKLGLVYNFGASGPSAAMAAMREGPRKIWADSWAGPYAGLYFGAGAGRATETYSSQGNQTFVSGANVSVTNLTAATRFAGDVNGSMNDVFLGYNWRNGMLVAGVQAEGSLFSDVSFKVVGPLTTVATTTTNGVPTSATTRLDAGWNNQQLRSNVGLIGRAGFLATPYLLLYGLGGLQFGHFVYPSTATGEDNGKWVVGYAAGAGGEWRINDFWSLRGEYRYMHFDVERNASTPSSSLRLPSGDTNSAMTTVARQTTADLHIGKIGVVYKFGGTGPASALAAIPSSVAAAWSDGWAGPYLGVYFGAGAGKARGNFTSTGVDNTGTVNTSNAALAGDMSGTQVDLFAGHNVRNDRFVLGGQIEGTQFSDVGFKTRGTAISQTQGIPDVSTSDTGYNRRLRAMVGVVGRAGFLATPDMLLYGLGGLALGHFSYPDGFNNFIATQTDPDGKWVTGYTVGGGGEMKIARHWSLRGEYRYLHFDVDSRGTVDQASSGPPPISSSGSFAYHHAADYHLGKIGLVYRFGDDISSAMAAMPRKSSACCDRWTGVTAGIYGSAGMGRVQDQLRDDSFFAVYFPPGVVQIGSTSNSTGTLAGDTQGGMIDLFAGYNWRAGNVVVGGQAEATIYSDVGLKSRGSLWSVSTALPAGPTNAGAEPAEFQQTLRSRAGLIARAGFLATPDLLLYGLAGAEFGHFAYLDGRDSRAGGDGQWAFGYTVGAGGELKLTDRWSLRGEYRYMQFRFNRTESSTDADSSFVTTFNNTIRTRADFNLGKLGVAYNFCYCD